MCSTPQAQCPHMVRLLHHYETASHRLFLLLEHVQGGRLVDLVALRREQWQRLQEAALNPPSSSLLRHHHSSVEREEKEKGEKKEGMQSEGELPAGSVGYNI